ncbi:MAG TPA: transglutaminase domain-containing protein [Caldisericia bacterium]|nr:transglutaminase domain-containing protein [Caldisericia bacterium]HPF48906.1 transglutaminase domain-containing protein [Caldisericia bacterium]HPI83230.1 transglutaminase domain-containing protein [Caldisericia bacterium]HPQ92457.1 transglutaminase domain-containing protein [Caldisericia bacterium]HRV74445.1 transglutaminase domain-containing protein [Caldisericia bacterium]
MKKIITAIVCLVLFLTVFTSVSSSSDDLWYESQVSLSLAPGQEIEFKVVDGEIVIGENQQNQVFEIVKNVPDWLSKDLDFALTRLSKSAKRLGSGAFAQACTLLPDNIEVLVISGYGETPYVINLETLEEISIIPSKIDGFARLSLADINQDNESDLIICPKNGGWYWLAGPTFAIPTKGDKVKTEWARKQLSPLTNPNDPNLVEPYVSGTGLVYLTDEGEISVISPSDFVINPGIGYASVCSLGLVFADEAGDIRYIETIDGEVASYSSRSIGLLPSFDNEVHMTYFNGKLYVGNLEGNLVVCEKNDQGKFVLKGEKIERPFGRKLCPQIADINYDDFADLIWSDSEGTFVSYGPDWVTFEKLNIKTDTNIAVGDVVGDNKLEIITTSSGILKIHSLPDLNPIEFETEVEFGKHPHTAIGDANGDKVADIVVGNEDGGLKTLLGPDFKESDVLSSIDVGDFSYPCFGDFDGDGRDDLIVANVLGETYSFKATENGWIEHFSWKFLPTYPYFSVEDYYVRYTPEANLLYWHNDMEIATKYTDLLGSCNDSFLDEAAFVVAHTPTEVLRLMANMDQADIIIRNAKQIYDISKKLPYVELIEKDNYTTCKYKYDGKDVELPMEYYYWYVVHPRILFEPPMAIDASWWNESFEDRGMSQEDWWQHQLTADEFYNGENKVFWREGIRGATDYGESLEVIASRATNYYDAIRGVQGMMNMKDKIYTFGYLTNDLYPWQIFKKRYGSCGESSILLASLLRTALIPAYVVINRGEDHQWNEIWFPHGWTHADIGGLDNPAASSERMGNKTVSTVLGWRGDDYYFPVTKTVYHPEGYDYLEADSGYTDTASVDFYVYDIEGKPVEGAMIIIRSGWGGRNSISYWEYTNSLGKTHIDLGWEPYYIVDCISPYGTTGLSRFVVNEGENYEVTLNVPGKVSKTAPKLGTLGKATTENQIQIADVTEYQRPPNMITSSGYRLESYLSSSYGYRGTRDYTHIVEETGTVLSVNNVNKYALSGDFFDFVEGKTIKVSNPTKLSWKKVTLKVKVAVDELDFDFGLKAQNGDIVVKSGEPIKLEINPTSSTPIERIEWSLDGKKWHLWTDGTIETGMGGPTKPGEKEIHLRATVRLRDGTQTFEESVLVTVISSSSFINQPIFQDPPNPLDGASWVMGSFEIEPGQDYFLVKTSSTTEGLDMDVFLYKDKNGDGVAQNDECVGKSTSPSNDEKILLKDPDTGPYILLVHGCTCPPGGGRFNLSLSSKPIW